MTLSLDDAPFVQYRPIPAYPRHVVGCDGSVWALGSSGWSRLKRLKGGQSAAYGLCYHGRSIRVKAADLILLAFGPEGPGELGPSTRGEAHRNAKLGAAAVAAMRREAIANGLTDDQVVALAERHGVTVSCIRQALAYQVWKHVPPEGLPCGEFDASAYRDD